MTTGARRLEWAVVCAGLALAACILCQADDAAPIVFAAVVFVGAVVAWIAVQDLATFTISDSAVLTIAVVAAAERWAGWRRTEGLTHAGCLAIGLDALAPGAALFLFRELYYRRKGFDGLGLGDVKLGAAGGLLVGGLGFSWALFSASLLALVWVGFSYALPDGRQLGRADKLAFGALLAPALWMVWVAEQWPILPPFSGR